LKRNLMPRLLLFLLFLLLGPVAALTLAAQVPGAAWETLTEAEVAAAGWSRAKLAEARAYADTLHTEAVMIVTRGKVLDAWGPVDQKFNVHSIRKSFLSALCGLEVEAGRLNLKATMDDLGIQDNPPALSAVERQATVHDLLKARSGIYHPALYETAGMKAQRPARHSHPPGTFWYYNNWDFNVTGTIYEQVAGTSLYEAFQSRIARPLAMQDYEVADGSYVTGEDSIHRAYPFRMTARDMARFGLLYLRGGRWGGQQVVPASWVEDSVTAHSKAGSAGGYGYFWWIAQSGLHLPGVTLPNGSFSARGAGGHYILVLPQLDLVLVHRVNTDMEGRRVESAAFGELVRRILIAHEPPAPTAAAPGSGSGSGSAELDSLLPWLMNQHRVPGVAVLGIENRRIAWETYFGVRAAGNPALVDEHTVFEAASMTKPLAAYAALKLAEQGQLDLDRPLTRYLPEPYLAGEPLHEKITARMVLTHTGGFPNWRQNQPLQVLHEPGSQFRYSGEGILFLQRVMEHLTGEDYEPFIQRTLMQPLHMQHSSHVWQARFDSAAAAGHDGTGQVKANRPLYTRPNAAYSLYTTPRDYAAFVLEMMNPDRSRGHFLSAESLQLMLTPASPPTGSALLSRRGSQGRGDVRYGLGWSVEPAASGPRIRHSGSNGTGFRSHAEFDPARGHGLVIMTNSTSGDALWKELVNRIGQP
jgi:CubicO group peptidase (beta-lactamase class C family)